MQKKIGVMFFLVLSIVSLSFVSAQGITGWVNCLLRPDAHESCGGSASIDSYVADQYNADGTKESADFSAFSGSATFGKIEESEQVVRSKKFSRTIQKSVNEESFYSDNKEDAETVIDSAVVEDCVDECVAGHVTCDANYLKTCGDWDDDSCLEWTSGILCTAGCSGSVCTTTEDSSEVQVQNDDETVVSLPDLIPLSVQWELVQSDESEKKDAFHKTFVSWQIQNIGDAMSDPFSVELLAHNAQTGEWRTIQTKSYSEGLYSGEVMYEIVTSELVNKDSQLKIVVNSAKNFEEQSFDNNDLSVRLKHSVCEGSQCIQSDSLEGDSCSSHQDCVLSQDSEIIRQPGFFTRILSIFQQFGN